MSQGTKMRTVNIAELKNRLSAYLNRFKNGEEIIVRDRDVPFARIVPLRSEDLGADRLKLTAEGRLRLGSGELLGESFWNLPGPRISMRHIIRAIDEDRNED